jgi:hypothetical protein
MFLRLQNYCFKTTYRRNLAILVELLLYYGYFPRAGGKFFQEKKLERNGSRREELEKSLFSKSLGEFLKIK